MDQVRLPRDLTRQEVFLNKGTTVVPFTQHLVESHFALAPSSSTPNTFVGDRRGGRDQGPSAWDLQSRQW